jgi:hypothetical protein
MHKSTFNQVVRPLVLIGFANNKIDNLDPYLHEGEKHLAKFVGGDGK